METLGLSRRTLLRATALAAMGAAAGPALAACAGPERTERPIRRAITSPAAQVDVETLRRAVTAMKALPETDPRNWVRQAQIHASHCRHSSWLFLPWHRAYLFYFEQICRELTGAVDFALPYWDWSASPRIPAPFWTPPLAYGQRQATADLTAGAEFVGAPVVASILDEPNFLLFAGAATGRNDAGQYGPGYGLVEQSLHNYVHGFVGGTMGSFSSPLDPVFWAHHSQIDHLWIEWNIARDHPNTDARDWSDTTFSDFVDGMGNPVRVSVLTTVLMPVVSYQYDAPVSA